MTSNEKTLAGITDVIDAEVRAAEKTVVDDLARTIVATWPKKEVDRLLEELDP